MEVPTPTGAIVSLLKAAITHQDHLWPLARSYKFLFRKRIRVSMASLIRFEHENNYILVKNRLRPECAAPFGGVIKYHSSARDLLDSIEYEHEKKASKDKDLERDLRGYIPAKNFGTFMTWFKSRLGREQAEAVLRELREECVEADIPDRISKPLSEITYSLFRTVHEGPYAHDHHDYATFRFFELYRPDVNGKSEKAIADLAEYALTPGAGVYVVSKEEIFNLRSEGRQQIAGSARYFFTSDWHGHEPPSF